MPGTPFTDHGGAPVHEPAFDSAPAGAGASIAAADLALLMPLHLILDPDGRIIAAGPTLKRLFAKDALIGQSLFDCFELRGPHRIADAASLASRTNCRLRLTIRDRVAPSDNNCDGIGGEYRDALPRLRLRGHLTPLVGGGFLLNTGFGVDTVPAAGLLQLAGSDFAPTDTAVELLYLVESNSAVIAETDRLLGQLEEARRQAEDEALTDPLTGLRNRRALDSLLARLCSERAAFSVLNIDLDGFKLVNDTLGHAAGDQVLVEVGRRLLGEVRKHDFVARVGGDEFVVVLPGLNTPGRLRFIGEAIVAALSRPCTFGEQSCRVTASIGIAGTAGGERLEPAEILARSDRGLYAAKRAGRGSVVLAAEIPAEPHTARANKARSADVTTDASEGAEPSRGPGDDGRGAAGGA